MLQHKRLIAKWPIHQLKDRLVCSLGPTVSVTGDYGHDRSITVNYDSLSTIGMEQVPWRVVTNMCFGNCQTASTDVGFANLSDDVMVIGNNVYRSDLGGVVPAASNVSLSLHAMRKAKTRRIIDLYSTAIRLEQQSRLLLTAPLSDQVRHLWNRKRSRLYLICAQMENFIWLYRYRSNYVWNGFVFDDVYRMAETDLNDAGVEDFPALAHIDQSMAESIVAYRTKHNGIPNVESLRVLNLSEAFFKVFAKSRSSRFRFPQSETSRIRL